MSFWQRLIGFTLCLGAQYPALASEPVKPEAVKADAKVRCWRIEQKNMLFGDSVVYAAPDMVKIVFKNGKFTDLAKGPKWELYVLNPTEKIFWHTKISEWKLAMVQLPLLNPTGPLKLVPSGAHRRIGGLEAIEVYPRAAGITTVQSNNNAFWITRDLKLAEPIERIMCGNTLLPKMDAVPLQVRAQMSNVGNILETKSSSQVDMPVSFFSMPVGYKETKVAEDVMNTGVMDIVKDMTGF